MLGIATAALMLLGIGAANASTVYSGALVDWTIGSSDSLTKIFLDQEPSSPSITGHVGSQGSTTLVDFTSATNLQSGSGWSTIKAANPPPDVKELWVIPDNFVFNALRFRLNMPSQSNDDVKLTVYFEDGSTTEDRDFTCCGGGDELGNGENKILIESKTSLLMKALRISGINNLFEGFDQVKQFGISGPRVPAVPVPAAVWLFGTASIGFVGMSRRRKLS